MRLATPRVDVTRPHGDLLATASATVTTRPVRPVCPECGEPVRHVPPTARQPWAGHGRPVPAWSHTDGEPLCPVSGPNGSQPADPVEAA